MDATFEVSAIPVFELVFHHKAGGRQSARRVNQDYHEALEALISRLAQIAATILGIAVDSAVARELDPSQRELALDFPIELTPSTSAHEIRLQITRAQKRVARRPNTKAGGGNDQKRIRITLSLESAAMSADDLVRQLIGARKDAGHEDPVAGRAPASPPFDGDREPPQLDAPRHWVTGASSGPTPRSVPTTAGGAPLATKLQRPMANKQDLQWWVTEALEALGGTGSVVDVAREIWRRHEADLRASGDLFYTWQYDMRWAAQALRDTGQAKSAKAAGRGLWELEQ